MASAPDNEPRRLSEQEIQQLQSQGAVLLKVEDILAERAGLPKHPLPPEQVERWYHRGGFFDPEVGGDNIAAETFFSLLEAAKQGQFLFWFRADFEPDAPPKPDHHGLSLCMKCGWVYWSSIDDDAFAHQEAGDVGQICLPCLVALG